ncbi:MAG: lipid II flippase MurJ, partial [Pseudomonadota bacterium]|nr:lipid II flippase MurJ [Pseudomonadota bacterium]
PRVRRLMKLMLPGAVGAGVVQINLLIDVVIASLLPVGSVSFLYFADRVNQLPLGVIGVAVGTALLPLLSRQLHDGADVDAMDSMNRASEFALLLTVPASIALIIIPEQIVSVLFERGVFGVAETEATAAALVAYSIGLPAYVMIKVLGPGFFAREDTVTPVKIAALCVAFNLVLNLLLMAPLLHVGIALATAMSAWVNVGFMVLVLRRRGHLKFDARFKRVVPRLLLASAVMAVAVVLSKEQLVDLKVANALAPWQVLTAIIVVGLSVFAATAGLLGAARLSDIKRMLDRSSR